MNKKDIAFLLCLFLGLFGVHKFYERKIGIGIVYLLTAGIFGIGWIVDIVRYIREKTSLNLSFKIILTVLVFLFVYVPLGSSDTETEVIEEPEVVQEEVVEEPEEEIVIEEPEEEIVIEEPEVIEEVLPGVGEVVEADKYSLVVNDFYETSVLVSDNMFQDDLTTSGKFIVIDITIKNKENTEENYNYSDLRLVSGDMTFSALDSLDINIIFEDYLWFIDVNPGMSTTSKIVFEIPADVTEYNLEMGIFDSVEIELQ